MKVSFIAFCPDFNYNTGDFFHRYFINHQITTNYKETDLLVVGSFVHEKEYKFIKTLNCKKILYICEPIQYFYPFTYYLFCENHFLMIFGCINHDLSNNRFKFPFYTMNFDYSFYKTYLKFHDKTIFINTNEYVKTCSPNTKKDCCLINRNNFHGSRTDVYNTLKEILKIDCPSQLFNNCSNEELNAIGNVEYIKKYKFQICPENTRVDIPGYITEKLANSVLGGAIPIYYGYYDDIDEKIFNKNRILFFDKDNMDSIIAVKNKIIFLLNNPEEFTAFYEQEPFCETAYETLISLENDLLSFINTVLLPAK